MDEVLIRLARMSPSNYAGLIRVRNMQLLESLQRLEPYIGKLIRDIPDDVARMVIRSEGIGCPHCVNDGMYRCERCIWNDLGIKTEGCKPCCIVKFYDVALADVGYTRQKTISVSYGHSLEAINLGDSELCVDAAEFERCRKFLQGHIDWSNMDCWGAALEVKVPKEEEPCAQASSTTP